MQVRACLLVTNDGIFSGIWCRAYGLKKVCLSIGFRTFLLQHRWGLGLSRNR